MAGFQEPFGQGVSHSLKCYGGLPGRDAQAECLAKFDRFWVDTMGDTISVVRMMSSTAYFF